MGDFFAHKSGECIGEKIAICELSRIKPLIRKILGNAEIKKICFYISPAKLIKE